MDPALGFGIIAVLVFVQILVRWTVRRQRRQRRRRALRKSTSPLSARTEARALDQAYIIMGPTTIREVEDEVPTIDEHGNRHVVIRTRALETVLGPIGPVEIERDRRLTLPGHGHVIPLSDTEFEVFRDHLKLRLDVEALQNQGDGRSR
jgi:hypothetical protein